jgi:polysaccharide deacetylase family protein (PEP-CTERM system associated)
MSGAERPTIVNAMTVDVEDYFQVSAFDRVVSRDSWETQESRVAGNTDQLLELFDRFDVHATFFILGWVADRAPELVRRIAGAGHEIACHGYHHQILYNLTPRQFREDVRQAKGTLEQMAGCPVVGFRAPSYSVTNTSLWALDVLIEEGFLYDASIFPIHHDRYGIPDAPRRTHVLTRASGSLVEIPGSTVRIGGVNLPIAGGGYFRLLPYAWTRWGIRRVNETEREPVVFYLHPWEIDPDQPRLHVGQVTRMRHYTGLGRTAGRLTQLLTDFRFDSLATMMAPARPVASVEMTMARAAASLRARAPESV